ncbi:MAG TPA: RagB/SusD family nutrient uptake outer membrane protein, partial [Gemmatimonadaceae bacterium]|nr:RagB/SusD family nutrient uptake outer membrane protein [Gemmatimonadaceae bacterium]
LGSAVVVEALIAGEMNDAQLGAAQWDYARRTANALTNGIYGTAGCAATQAPGIYLPLSTARFDADHAITNLTTWTDAQVPGRVGLLAVADLYAGFSYAFLGMSMCQAAFDNGPAVNQKGMFALAEKRFTDAIANAQAAGADSIRFAAYVGRARVRLYQGNTAGALADAQLVPKGFVFNSSNSATALRLYNRVFAVTKQFGFYSIPSWSQNLTTENGEIDPRSATQLAGTRSANNNQTIVFVPNKYVGGDAVPMPIARYEEAQLIIAEVQGGAQAVSIINAMRATVGLKPYTGATDAASIKNLVISERQRVLFIEGFRNYDIERFQIPFNPPVGASFPVGGGTYGNTTCLPLPDIEKNNNPSLGPSFVPSTTGA